MSSTEANPPDESRVKAISADIIAGTSIALVLLPQSLAYAALAGMPPYIGLYASVLPPILAAIFASSKYLQTGPTAVTGLLTFAALAPIATAGTEHYVALAGLLALMVGVIRIVAGLLGGGALTNLLSPPVLQGFTVGAAVLIAASQLPTVLGISKGHDGVLQEAGSALWSPNLWDLESIGITAVTLLIVVGGRKLGKLFPGVLVASAGGLIYSHATDFSGATIGTIPEGFLTLTASFPWEATGMLLIPAFVIAVIGFAEPTAIARTYAAADRTRWDANREFISQGVANVAAAFSGAFPTGGSFSRSALSRLVGTRTRWSAVVTGLVIAAFLPFANVLGPLPRPVLAGIILAAVVNLLKFRALAAIWRSSGPQAAIAWTTLAVTLVMAPRIEQAVLVGMLFALAVHAWREMRAEVVISYDEQSARLRLEPLGVLWFGSSEAIQERMVDGLAQHSAAQHVDFDLDGLGRIDYTGAIVLRETIERAEQAGLVVHVVCWQPQCERILRAVIPSENLNCGPER